MQKRDYVQQDVEAAFRSQARELAAALTRMELAELEVAASARWVAEAQEHFDQLRAHLIQIGGNTGPGVDALGQWHQQLRCNLERMTDQELLKTQTP